MAQGHGAFVVAELCNRVNAEGTKEEKRLLQTWFTGGGISENIRDREMKGKSVLLESIKDLLSTKTDGGPTEPVVGDIMGL